MTMQPSDMANGGAGVPGEPGIEFQLWKPQTRSEVAAFVAHAAVDGFKNRRVFRDVEYFLFLVGYPRSGSTLVGTLLNAHPEMVVAHESDIIRYVRPGITRNELFAILLMRDRQFAEIGRRFNGFDYAVGGGSQGQFDRLRVIGDKHAGRAERRLHADPGRLDRLRRVVRVPIRVLHITRNPFDVVASIAGNRGLPIAKGIEIYRELSVAVDDVRDRLSETELFEFKYEELAETPVQWMRDICAFIGVGASDAYLEMCAALIDPGGRRGRARFEWSVTERRELEELIAARPVLAGYVFDE